MIDLSYTDKDGLNPAEGFTEVFNYHKDGNPSGDGYEHGGYPEITGETSPYPSTSYKTGDDPDFFHNGNVYEQPETAPNHGFSVNGTLYDTMEEALQALVGEANVDFKLYEDLVLGNKNLVFSDGQNAVLDLNGKKITSTKTGTTNGTIINSGHLEIKGDGEVVGSKRSINTVGESAETIVNGGTYTSKDCAFDIANGGTLIVNDADVTAQEFAILVTKGSHLTVNGGTFNAIDNAVLGTNGTKDTGDNDITINGGVFNGHIVSAGYVACGIYLANNDHLAVNNGTFNIENGCGILVRSGEATVADGVVINVSGDMTGKVGDSRVVVPCKPLVVDMVAHYPGGEPSLVNETGYEVYEIVA